MAGKNGISVWEQVKTRQQRCPKDIVITRAANITPVPNAPSQPRAVGDVRLSVKPRGSRSVIDGFRQSGSMKCLFPRQVQNGLDAVLVNTAGGVTGGDHFQVSAYAQRGTELTLTTQACERAYRAQQDTTGRVRTSLRVGDGARLNWLPQETILFDGSALDRKLRVELADNAHLLLVEPLIFGRAAMGELVKSALLNDRIEIRRNGRPQYLDAVRLNGDLDAHMAQRFVGRGALAMASVVMIDPRAEAHLRTLRDLLPDTAGASLFHDDTLVLRCLAEDSFELRRTLIPVLKHLGNGPLPRCWMI